MKTRYTTPVAKAIEIAAIQVICESKKGQTEGLGEDKYPW